MAFGLRRLPALGTRKCLPSILEKVFDWTKVLPGGEVNGSTESVKLSLWDEKSVLYVTSLLTYKRMGDSELVCLPWANSTTPKALKVFFYLRSKNGTLAAILGDFLGPDKFLKVISIAFRNWQKWTKSSILYFLAPLLPKSKN